MLIALTITATLLTATLAALDSSFKAYKVTTDGASNHVVARIVMHRVMSMLRNGTSFGPYPVDVLDANQNPLLSNFIEFEAVNDPESGLVRIVRLERRTATDANAGPYELWYVQTDYVDGEVTVNEARPLMGSVQDITFTLDYDVGPRLRRATVDLIVRPTEMRQASISSDLHANNLRLVSSVSPRRLDE
jgi:hypothetical protein